MVILDYRSLNPIKCVTLATEQEPHFNSFSFIYFNIYFNSIFFFNFAISKHKLRWEMKTVSSRCKATISCINFIESPWRGFQSILPANFKVLLWLNQYNENSEKKFHYSIHADAYLLGYA